MTSFSMRRFTSLSAMTLLGLSLAGAPALAEKGGNGGGNGGGHAGGNGGGNSASHGNSASAAKSLDSKSLNYKKAASPKLSAAKATAKVALAEDKNLKGKTASSLGKLNGFLHASDKALAHTSRSSAIGKVLYGYGDLLKAYLVSPVDGTAAPTLAQLAAALAAAGNKPLTEAAIAAVNARLLSYSPTLAENLKTSGKTAKGLAEEISGAL